MGPYGDQCLTSTLGWEILDSVDPASSTHTNLTLPWGPDETALQEAVNFLLKVTYEDQTIFFTSGMKIR